MHKQKNRGLKQEHQPQKEPIFTKKKVKEPRFFQKPKRKEITVLGQINQSKQQALQLLDWACHLIAYSQPDQNLSNQSKAIELAQKYIDTGIGDIQYIQDVLYQIKDTLKEYEFTSKSIKDYSNAIDLGVHFKYLSRENQITSMLQHAIKISGIPNRTELTGSGCEHIDPSKAWAEYIVMLCQMLPEKPLLITGTPTAKKEKEEDTESGENNPGGIRGLLNNLLGRNKSNS